VDVAESRRDRRARERADARERGPWFPRWFWPSFSAPGIIWIAIFFVVATYLIFAVAFGLFDFNTDQIIPVYQPWYWQFGDFTTVAHRVCCGESAFYQTTFVRTFAYVFTATALSLVIGYAVAYFVARYGGSRKALFLILLVLPFWISYLMRMYAWQGLLQDDGLVNRVLTTLHLIPDPVNWLEGRSITVILGLVYGYIPYMILPLFGALDRIHQSLLEAGRDLGAGPMRTFFRVTLPLSKQAILAALVIVALPMFGDYYTNALLSTSPQTNMIGNLIDEARVAPGRSGEAASLVIILLVILIVPMLYYLRSARKASEQV
jgi:ABC-type spermidine/putrescine transport system permease subunit I